MMDDISSATLQIRKEFPETWIWDTFDAPDGIITLNKTVPDTITSWLITGFSTNSESGLGLTKAPRKLTVFKPFFISLNLPYSVKRGEILSLEANVFNYMDEDVTADVTLYNEENEFEFTEITNEVLDTPKAQETQQKQTIKIEANSGATVTFLIKPIKVGGMIIKMMATTAMAGDAIQQILPVKADGLPQYNTKSDFIVLCEKKEDESTLAFEVPDDIVPDSTVVEVSVVGDILGQTIKHLDQLIRLPAGCGEQNMLNFVPNVVILNYLKHTNQTTPKVEAKAKRYLESGYQQELAFQRYDGSFSAFGRNDVSGSIWLTAFVAKSFRQASVYIDIDDVIIENALKWLSENQASNGSFPEVGKVIHGEMQSSANGGMALTAYVLTAFLENQGPIPSYQYVITKALEYIDENIPLIEDTYTLSIVAYALQLAEHTSKDSVFTSLDKQAKIVGDKKWWHKPLPKAEKISRWYSIQPNSVNVEMSAYGLLTFLEAKQFADALPIVKWLLEQRNSYGGFQSTQDTVVGLQALGKFAELIWTDKMNLKASINYEDTKQEITVNNENAALLQTYRLPSTVRSVNVKASGEGIALLQLSYKYNLQTPEGWQQFTLKPIVKKQVNPNFIQLSVCTSFVPIEGATLSNMAIMEITFPSGYVADRDTISALEGTKSIQKVELKNGDTLVIVYFDALSSQRVCPVFYAYRTYKIADQKPASVAIYDYYENSRRAEAFYEIEKATICDICEGPECKKACAVEKVEATTENETELKCTFFLCKKLCNKKIKV